MSENTTNSIDFEKLLQTSVSLPLVHIDRSVFLKKELKKYCDEATIELAIEKNPAYAKVSTETINKIAKDCIKYETLKVSSISFATGLPGGVAMAATIPADIAQYYAHILRVIQKLAYLYGWQNLIDDSGNMDDGTSHLLTLFTGVMFGVQGANTIVRKLSESMSQHVGKTLMNKALTKGMIYPIVKKISTILGVKMTKEIFAKGVSKVIPVVGGVVSGGITLVTFMPMSYKFKNYLSGLDLANVEKLDDRPLDENELIDIDFSDVLIEDIEDMDDKNIET